MDAEHRRGTLWEGWLRKAGQKNKEWKRRFFRLQHGTLMYAEDRRSTARRAIKLQQARGVCWLDTKFIILSSQRVWLLEFEDPSDRGRLGPVLEQFVPLAEVLLTGYLNKRAMFKRWHRRFFLLLSVGHVLRFMDDSLTRFVDTTDLAACADAELKKLPDAPSSPCLFIVGANHSAQLVLCEIPRAAPDRGLPSDASAPIQRWQALCREHAQRSESASSAGHIIRHGDYRHTERTWQTVLAGVDAKDRGPLWLGFSRAQHDKRHTPTQGQFGQLRHSLRAVLLPALPAVRADSEALLGASPTSAAELQDVLGALLLAEPHALYTHALAALAAVVRRRLDAADTFWVLRALVARRCAPYFSAADGVLLAQADARIVEAVVNAVVAAQGTQRPARQRPAGDDPAHPHPPAAPAVRDSVSRGDAPSPPPPAAPASSSPPPKMPAAATAGRDTPPQAPGSAESAGRQGGQRAPALADASASALGAGSTPRPLDGAAPRAEEAAAAAAAAATAAAAAAAATPASSARGSPPADGGGDAVPRFTDQVLWPAVFQWLHSAFASVSTPMCERALDVALFRGQRFLVRVAASALFLCHEQERTGKRLPARDPPAPAGGGGATRQRTGTCADWAPHLSPQRVVLRADPTRYPASKVLDVAISAATAHWWSLVRRCAQSARDEAGQVEALVMDCAFQLESAAQGAHGARDAVARSRARYLGERPGPGPADALSRATWERAAATLRSLVAFANACKTRADRLAAASSMQAQARGAAQEVRSGTIGPLAVCPPLPDFGTLRPALEACMWDLAATARAAEAEAEANALRCGTWASVTAAEAAGNGAPRTSPHGAAARARAVLRQLQSSLDALRTHCRSFQGRYENERVHSHTADVLVALEAELAERVQALRGVAAASCGKRFEQAVAQLFPMLGGIRRVCSRLGSCLPELGAELQ